MKIKCQHCSELFTASHDQTVLIENSQAKSMKFIMLECPVCYHGFSMNPSTLDLSVQPERVVEDGLRCPNEACYGIVSFIAEKKLFWGCGECGEIWNDKSDLWKAIEKSIKKYPYRSKVYIKEGGNFIAVPLYDEPQNYEEMVEKEWNNID